MFEILLPNAKKWVDLDNMGIDDPFGFCRYLEEIISSYELPFDKDSVKFRCDYPEVQSAIDKYQPNTDNFKIFMSRIFSIYEKTKISKLYGEKINIAEDIAMLEMLNKKN